MSDFSLMDAVESGILKLPRVPVADNVTGEMVPKFRDLWEHGKKMPKKGKGGTLDPLAIPVELDGVQGPLRTLRTQFLTIGRRRGSLSHVSSSCVTTLQHLKLIYDYISGFQSETADGQQLETCRLALFRNFDEFGTPLPKPRTLLIDSAQIE
jgi:type III restriction enzyme